MEEAEIFKCFFIVYCDRNRSSLVCDLISYISLFVGQLCPDKSLVPHYHVFTSDYILLTKPNCFQLLEQLDMLCEAKLPTWETNGKLMVSFLVVSYMIMNASELG